MEGRRIVGSVMIFCGTLCVLAAVAATMHAAHLTSRALNNPVYGRTVQELGYSPRYIVPDWTVIVIFFVGLVGLAMIVVGLLVALSRARKTAQQGSPSHYP